VPPKGDFCSPPEEAGVFPKPPNEKPVDPAPELAVLLLLPPPNKPPAVFPVLLEVPNSDPLEVPLDAGAPKLNPDDMSTVCDRWDGSRLAYYALEMRIL